MLYLPTILFRFDVHAPDMYTVSYWLNKVCISVLKYTYEHVMNIFLFTWASRRHRHTYELIHSTQGPLQQKGNQIHNILSSPEPGSYNAAAISTNNQALHLQNNNMRYKKRYIWTVIVACIQEIISLPTPQFYPLLKALPSATRTYQIRIISNLLGLFSYIINPSSNQHLFASLQRQRRPRHSLECIFVIKAGLSIHCPE